MIGIRWTVLGVVIVFDMVATLGGATIATLGGVAVPTLGVASTGDGASGIPDMIADTSCVIAARCFIFALAVFVGMVPSSFSKMLPTARRVLSCSDKTGTWQ
jgi:hypothetical protein